MTDSEFGAGRVALVQAPISLPLLGKGFWHSRWLPLGRHAGLLYQPEIQRACFNSGFIKRLNEKSIQNVAFMLPCCPAVPPEASWRAPYHRPRGQSDYLPWTGSEADEGGVARNIHCRYLKPPAPQEDKEQAPFPGVSPSEYRNTFDSPVVSPQEKEPVLHDPKSAVVPRNTFR